MGSDEWVESTEQQVKCQHVRTERLMRTHHDGCMVRLNYGSCRYWYCWFCGAMLVVAYKIKGREVGSEAAIL